MARGISLADMLGNYDTDDARESAPVEQPAPAQPATVTPPRQERAQRAAPKPKYRPKVSFYQDPADTDRVRGRWWSELRITPEGVRAWTKQGVLPALEMPRKVVILRDDLRALLDSAYVGALSDT